MTARSPILVPRQQDHVRLLDADPDLGARLSPERRGRARQELIAPLRRLAVGPWAAYPFGAPTPGSVGLLIVDGVLSFDVTIEERLSVELLGPGDVVRPWETPTQDSLLAVHTSWSVRSPLAVANLDERFSEAATRYPEVLATLFERLTDRAMRLATTQAISQLTGVERRLTALLWHLAERWGRVTPEGVLVPLALSHSLLGQLVGARRPTVSTALAQLGRRGDLVRRADGSWLLRGESPGHDALARRAPARPPADVARAAAL
jgi:CRP/FNR family transcriptional regulator, cyclic AMP receptor protein